MESLLRRITQLYGLKLISSKKVADGFLSDNYILGSGNEKYFLKRYRFKNIERIKEIHSVKSYFFNGGIPVIMPILNNNKESFFEYESEFHALFPFIDERKLKEKDITDEVLISSAETLARLHLLGRDSKLIVKDFHKPWDKQARLQDIEKILHIISVLQIKTEFDIHAEKNLLLKKQIIGSNEKPYEAFKLQNDHLIHGDYTIGNLFFDEHDHVSHVFDFEKTEYAPRYFELFRSMIYSVFLNKIGEGELVRSKLYLDSYRTLYPATKEELINGFTAYYLRSAHSLWVESEHYLKGNIRIDELLKTDVLRLEYLSRNLEETLKYLFD